MRILPVILLAVTLHAACTIATSSLPSGTVATTYSQAINTLGCDAPAFSLSVGTLPAGLTLGAASGVIGGTPTTGGSSSFTVAVTDTSGNPTQALSITINAATAPTITTTSPLPAGTQNVAYSTILAATGSIPITWSITAGTLPSGLALSSAGAITGTPGTAGASSFTIQASNTAGTNAVAFSLTINASTGPPAFPTTTLTQQVKKKPDELIRVASASAIFPRGFPIPAGGIGNPTGTTLTILMVDTEAMCVNYVLGNTVWVERACQGTYSANHKNGRTVYAGQANWYLMNDPAANTACIAANQPVLPRITLLNGNLWSCVNGLWKKTGNTAN